MKLLDAPSNEAGWFADPGQRWPYRWFDGNVWTANVSDGTNTFEDAESLAQAIGDEFARSIAASNAEKQGRVARVVKWTLGIVFGGSIAFLALGVFLVAIGYEPESDALIEVEGGEVFYLQESNGTARANTWVVLVDEELPASELAAIAERILALPAASGEVDIQLFDDEERMEEVIASYQVLMEFDESGDVGVLLEGVEDFDEESFAAMTARLTLGTGSETYLLCVSDGEDCSGVELLAEIPR